MRGFNEEKFNIELYLKKYFFFSLFKNKNKKLFLYVLIDVNFVNYTSYFSLYNVFLYNIYVFKIIFINI